MPEQATVYENYRDVDETTPKHWRAATTIGFFDQQTPLREIQERWSKGKHALRYFFNEGEIISELATGIKEYVSTTAITESGVTYILASSVPLVIIYDPEQEIEFFVKMSPKAVRNTIVRITARHKGMPNPML
jgi:hypothetical protein